MTILCIQSRVPVSRLCAAVKVCLVGPELLLRATRDLHGETGTAALLQAMAGLLHRQLSPRVGGTALTDRVDSIAKVMEELGYEATVDQGELASITALSCVYHHLAAQFPEVCKLDVDLFTSLSGARVEHAECMVTGGHRCRFVFRPKGEPQ